MFAFESISLVVKILVSKFWQGIINSRGIRILIIKNENDRKIFTLRIQQWSRSDEVYFVTHRQFESLTACINPSSQNSCDSKNVYEKTMTDLVQIELYRVKKLYLLKYPKINKNLAIFWNLYIFVWPFMCQMLSILNMEIFDIFIVLRRVRRSFATHASLCFTLLLYDLYIQN